MILILGPPGAGKSVQAKLLDEQGKVQWLSVGKILRDHISTLPDVMKNQMTEGKLVNDDLVSKVLKTAIEATDDEPVILIDGFPRRRSQVQWLENYLAKNNRAITGIIHLKLPQRLSVERLRKRGRIDDDEQTVIKRYAQYEDEVLQVIEAFGGEGVPIHEIDGDNTIENIHSQIMADIQ